MAAPERLCHLWEAKWLKIIATDHKDHRPAASFYFIAKFRHPEKEFTMKTIQSCLVQNHAFFGVPIQHMWLLSNLDSTKKHKHWKGFSKQKSWNVSPVSLYKIFPAIKHKDIKNKNSNGFPKDSPSFRSNPAIFIQHFFPQKTKPVRNSNVKTGIGISH